MGKRVTLKDIAEATGFCVMTVSNVLTGKKPNHASPRNRKLIEDTARRLNYRPNLNARQLATSKSNIIGLLIDTRSPLFYQEIMMELEHLAFGHGYRLQVGMVHNNLRAIQQYLDDFLGMGVENVICAVHSYPEFGEQIPPLFENFRKVVFLEEPLTATCFPFVGSAHYQNHYQAVSAMLAYGYRRIVCIRHNYRDRAFSASYQGIQDAYLHDNLTWDEDFWRVCSSIETGPDSSFSSTLQEVLKNRLFTRICGRTPVLEVRQVGDISRFLRF